jgi:hypothetical protein
MRFMMLMYPSENAEKGVMPDPKLFEAMMKYNEELAKAGVLLSLDGLHPTAKGARVTFPDGKAVVTDGPFTEGKEIIGGFWMIQVKSKEEAIEWAKRIPQQDTRKVELRQVFEMTDFPAEVQKVADSPSGAKVRATIEKTGRA